MGASKAGKDTSVRSAASGAECAVDGAGLAPDDAVIGSAAAWKGFCKAFASIMARSLENPKAPVLLETKVEAKLLEKKAEFKEKKMLMLQAKVLKDQGHTVPDITKKAFEMQLRKVATQGVVRLFNTVKEFQLRGEEEIHQQRQLNKVP